MRGSAELGELEDKATRIMEIITRLAPHDVSQPETRKDLLDLVAELDVLWFEGTISAIMHYYDLDKLFNFYASNTNTSYVSLWPDWAFERAKVALSGGKAVVVASTGDPRGDNIVAAAVAS
jgi:hypothetical protein